MGISRDFVDLNRAATERLRRLASRLSDAELLVPVGAHWTVAIVFAHLAFLDRRADYVLAASERAGEVINPDWHIFVNDVALPLWAAIPPREAVRLAIEAAEAVDARLEALPMDLLQEVHAEYPRYVYRSRHRHEHLDEAEEALRERSRARVEFV